MASPKDSIRQKEGDNKNGWENKTTGNREPCWYANIEQPIKFTKLTDNILSSARESMDVVIVGGGIAVPISCSTSAILEYSLVGSLSKMLSTSFVYSTSALLSK